MNSDNETPQKESDKPGDSPEKPTEKVVGKAKEESTRTKEKTK